MKATIVLFVLGTMICFANTGFAQGPLIGDSNCDGAINLLDIAAFTEDLANFQYDFKSDINQDGFDNLLDVQPFIDLLTLPCGDVNGDGVLNLLDVDPFIDALIDWLVNGVYNPRADLDRNGTVDFVDLNLFNKKLGI